MCKCVNGVIRYERPELSANGIRQGLMKNALVKGHFMV